MSTPLIDRVKSKAKGLLQREGNGRDPLPFPPQLIIETSYACNLKCVMCTRDFDTVPQETFSLEMFRERVEPLLPRFKTVNLAGWGEPLMNPHFVEILRGCKEAGLFTCFNTNGLLLKGSLARRILEAEPDAIYISCDGSTPGTYEYVRGKGTFDVLQTRMRDFVALRNEMGVKTEIDWVYVLLKHNLDEMPACVPLAAAHGMDHVRVKHMETALSAEELGDALWNTGIAPDLTPEWEERYQRAIAEATRLGEEHGIAFVPHPRRFSVRGMCLVPPDENIFIDQRGNVSACCYLTEIDNRPYVPAEERSEDKGILGNLREQTLLEIIESERYERFRREWLAGQVPASCRGCVNVNRMTSTSV